MLILLSIGRQDGNGKVKMDPSFRWDDEYFQMPSQDFNRSQLQRKNKA